MQKIPLTNSRRKATVDDEDYAFLSQWTWFETGDGYAARLDAARGVVSGRRKVGNVRGGAGRWVITSAS